MLKIIGTTFFVFTINGCASLAQSRWQDISVITSGDQGLSSICSATNEEGQWNDITPKQKARVHRDGNPINIVCENSDQKGMSKISPIFMTNLLIADVFFDFCTISCLVDAGYNSLYKYPDQIVVKMEYIK